MFDIFRKNPQHTAIIILTVGLIAAIYLGLVLLHTMHQNDGNIGALLDDTWIHVRFADHVSQGEGLSYNEGELTAGATSLLWILLLAIPFALFDPNVMQQVDIAIIMSAISHVLTVLAITGFGWWAMRRAWIGFAAGVITALTGRYVWMGLTGMEITTFTTLCILSVWSHMHDVQQHHTFSVRTGLIVALTSLARPEAYLLTAFIGLDAFIVVPLRDSRHHIVTPLRQGWRGIATYIFLAGTYPLANLVISGYPVPNTFRAKSQLGRETPDLPKAFWWMTNVDHGSVFIVMAGIGTAYLLWRAWKRSDSLVWGLWPPTFIMGVLLLGAERYVVNHSRYIAPAIPFIALAAVVGVWSLAQMVAEKWLRRYLIPVGVVGAFAVVTLIRGAYNGEQVANDVKQLRAMHVAAGYWFNERVAPDQSIALNDVGAMVHISDRRVIDLEGLVYPDIIDATQNTPDQTCEHDLQLARVMLHDPPLFIGVFPWFYPCLTGWPGALQPEHIFTITGPTVLAGGETVIYWPIWKDWPMLAAIPDEAIPVGTYFEEGIELAAYQAHVVEPGLEVTLWWQAHAQPAGDYHIFVHVVDTNNNLVRMNEAITLQHDSEPQQRGNHSFKTSWWRPGDIIRDIHLIEWDDTSVFQQPGLGLNVGVYRYPAGTRLLTNDAADYVHLSLSDPLPNPAGS